MRIALTSVLVHDQQHALEFYTKKLGFVVKKDLPMGDYRWLTVAAVEEFGGPELLLEPNQFPPATTYQKALYNAGIAATAFAVDNLKEEHQKLLDVGVRFHTDPVDVGGAIIAVFDDTCGNLIQIYETTESA